MAVYTDNGGSVNGSNKDFTYSFPTIKSDGTDVKVALNGQTQATNKYTVTTTSPTKITFNSTDVDSTLQESTGAPKTGVTVRVFRDTYVDAAEAVYAAGSSIRAADLNNNQDQVLFALQEEQQLQLNTEDIANDAITSAKLADNIDIAGTLDVTGNIVADAAITINGSTTALGDALLVGNTTVYPATGQTKDFKVKKHDGTDKFTVSSDTGNTTVAGTLGVTGTTTAGAINASGAVGVDGNFDVNTNKFTVASSTGNTNIGGYTTIEGVDGDGDSLITLGGIAVAGSILGVDNLTIKADNKELAVQNAAGADKFTVDTDNGNTVIEGTLNGKGAVDFDTTLNVDGTATLATVDINAGAIDGTTIGANSAAAGTFTTVNNLTTTELAILDGATVSTSELNILDGVTADKDEINLLDGKSFKASTDGTLDSTSDTEIPSSKAINARIVAVAEQIGGFVPIADKDNFPTSNPDPNGGVGTVVSISDAVGISVNSSGVGSLATRAGGSDAVVINGFPASMRGGATIGTGGSTSTNANPYIIPSGVGLQVQTTAVAHTYTYHKVQATEQDVVELTDAIQDFQARYRIGTSNPGSDNQDGDLFYNTNTNKMLVYRGDTSAWVDISTTGNFYNATLTSVGAEGDTIPGGSDEFNSTAKKFGINLTGDQAPTNAFQITVSLNGVIQKPNSGTSVPSEGFAWDATNGWLIFADAVPATDNFFIVVSGSNVNVTTVQDNEIDLAQLKHQDAGDILYYAASGVPTLLTKDVGKFLKSGTNGPTWDTVTTTTNLSNTANGTSLTVESSTGTNTALPAATTSAWGVMTDEDKTKLDGIEASADVTDATNVTSAGAVMKSIIDTKGDIIVGTADNTYAKLAAGTNTYVLTADSSETAGLKWAEASSGTITALNNQTANRLTTIGATTTELDGEANLTFDGSTLAITGNQTVSTTLAATGQITGRGFECPAEVSDDWTIAAGNNAMFPGPMTVATGKTVTVPSGRTLTVV